MSTLNQNYPSGVRLSSDQELDVGQYNNILNIFCTFEICPLDKWTSLNSSSPERMLSRKIHTSMQCFLPGLKGGKVLIWHKGAVLHFEGTVGK